MRCLLKIFVLGGALLLTTVVLPYAAAGEIDPNVEAKIRAALPDKPAAMPAGPRTLLVFGEVGLAGEIRPVPHGEERLREAAKLGLTHAIAPAANVHKKAIDQLHVIGVKSLGEALDALNRFG